jgi:hypothetical protein
VFYKEGDRMRKVIAKSVIVSVPLPILKKGIIDFIPELSADRVSAI